MKTCQPATVERIDKPVPGKGNNRIKRTDRTDLETSQPAAKWEWSGLLRLLPNMAHIVKASRTVRNPA